METCSDGHEEVVYVSRKSGCPVCEVQNHTDETIAELTEDVKKFQKEIDDHKCDTE